MSTPLFYLQIANVTTGDVVTLPGGGKLEADLIEACTTEALKRGVGFFRTEAHVREAIKEGFVAVISNLKRETRRVL
jgi:hypothetical protein